MQISNSLRLTPSGLYCEPGDFYIDPVQPVHRAVITHGHGDHARWGSRLYLCAEPSHLILRHRLGELSPIRFFTYGEPVRMNDVTLSLHPAGHILGSAQARIEYQGHITVVSGDYKVEPDPTCTPFEPVSCHTFVTESTFGLPIFRWQPRAELFGEINRWWAENRETGRTSVLFAYALGKAQRVIAGLDTGIGPIFAHGAVENVNACYRKSGIPLPETRLVSDVSSKSEYAGAMVIAPPSGDQPSWMKKFHSPLRAFASGWMRIRGNRRRRALDRGFVVSDHADWQGLLASILATGAENIWTTHGYAEELARYLREEGLNARALPREAGLGDGDNGVHPRY